MRGRSLAWGVLWGLVLEVLAILTPYGAVYEIRYAPGVLAIGFFAHVFYGLPLGGAVQEPENTDRAVHGPGWLRTTVVSGLGVALVAAFLALAWEGPGAPVAPGTVAVGPDALRSGWTRVKAGEPVVFEGRGAEVQAVRLPKLGQTLEVPPGERVELRIERAGIYQVIAEGRDWRSAFVVVERGPYPRE